MQKAKRTSKNNQEITALVAQENVPLVSTKNKRYWYIFSIRTDVNTYEKIIF